MSSPATEKVTGLPAELLAPTADDERLGSLARPVREEHGGARRDGRDDGSVGDGLAPLGGLVDECPTDTVGDGARATAVAPLDDHGVRVRRHEDVVTVEARDRAAVHRELDLVHVGATHELALDGQQAVVQRGGPQRDVRSLLDERETGRVARGDRSGVGGAVVVAASAGTGHDGQDCEEQSEKPHARLQFSGCAVWHGCSTNVHHNNIEI